MKQKKTPFIDWINTKTSDKVAELLNVNPSTVRHWRRGYTLPRVDQMRLIRKLTKGVLGYDEIIDNGVYPTTYRSKGNR